MKKKIKKGSARFLVEKGEELSVYVNGADGKFTMTIPGPGRISVVRTKRVKHHFKGARRRIAEHFSVFG